MKFDLDAFLKWFTYDPSAPMLFQTIPFFVLFALFYILYTLSQNKTRVRNFFLLTFCLFFYYKISGLFVFVLAGMALSDFLIAKSIHSAKTEKVKNYLMYVSVFINVGALIYFKYTYFFINLINDIGNQNISLSFKILQPIGISYFVFKSLSYVIDTNREIIEEPEKRFANYLIFVSYFPNILAGPITKARDFMPRLNDFKGISKKEISLAVFLISIGLIKKIAVADFISANITDRVFESPQFFSSIDLFMSAYAGLLQLFFDFSGYTDIAVGISLLLGIEIAGNFNQPFKAGNVSGFWKRWHISLYSWLSDYVHQPIAFALRKYKMTGAVIAIFFTFLISGLWHGPNLTYVIWGGLHGSAIVLEMITGRFRKFAADKLKSIYILISIFLTFNFLALTSVLINSPDVEFAFDFYSRIFTSTDFSLFPKWFSIYKTPFFIMTGALALQYLPLNWYSKMSSWFGRLPVFLIALFFTLLIILLYQIASKEALPFIYIEF